MDAFWAGMSAEERSRLVAEEQGRVVTARESLPNFFEYVMRDPFTRARLKCMSHQRVLFDFVEHHDRAVIVMPAGASKTFCMSTITMRMLGEDPTARGAIVSSTQEQAMKPVKVTSDYIDQSAALRRVYPRLRPSVRRGDKWTQTAITVDRPPGIPDPSLIALGVGGSILGARLNWIVVDDILDFENTYTEEARKKTYEWFDNSVLSRLDPRGARIVVCNTPWHPKDLVHMLEQLGWPTLRMDIMGGVQVQDDLQWMREGREPWGHSALRPATRHASETYYRLRAHDPDPDNKVPLWPERFSFDHIEKKLRHDHLPIVFNRMFMCITRDDDTALCKQEYIDVCCRLAREAGHRQMLLHYDGTNPTFTGVDLAFGVGSGHDETAFFTFEVLENGQRRILDIEIGQWPGPEIMKKLFVKQKAFNSVVRVESNGCFAPETRVLTRRGYVPIAEVAVGDMVWTHKHRWRPVKKLVASNAKTLTAVRAKGGLVVRCTPNHQFFLRPAGRLPGRKGGHHRPMGQPEWVSAGVFDRPAYVAVAVPTWSPTAPEIEVRAQAKSHARPTRIVRVDEEIGLLLGLYMAEGSSTSGQVRLTLNRNEHHLAAFAERAFAKMSPGTVGHYERGPVRTVVLHDTAMREAMAYGAGPAKRPPVAWWGWPLDVRMAMVRGWLMGDGCVLERNREAGWPSSYFAGCSISRDWLLLARATLHEAGYRAVLRECRRSGPNLIEGGTVSRAPIYSLELNADDSKALRASMSHEVEQEHWPPIIWNGIRTSSSVVVFDEERSGWAHGWSRLHRLRDDALEVYGGPVHDLVVAEDHSYVVEDMVVHNAQRLVRDFALDLDRSLPIKSHTTTLTGKAHPEYGVASMFLEMSNGAWLIPNDRGHMHPQVERFVQDCLHYVPSKHCPDSLMASHMAREQARQWGLLAPKRNNGQATGSIQASLLAR